DSIAFSITNPETLPTGSLLADGTLEFRPTPTDVGSYPFDIVASDGALEARQTVILDVVADPVGTTRVSGKVLQVNGEPLVGMPLEIGGVQGLTGNDGSFTL